MLGFQGRMIELEFIFLGFHKYNRSLDSGRDSIRSINKPPNTAALDEKNQLTFGEADRLETKHF